MAALLRDVPPAPTLARVSPPPASVQPGMPAWLPPAGELLPLIGRVLHGAGWLALAGMVIGARPLSNRDSQVRAAIDRFKLDPSRPADMAAAVAYAWALVNRSLLLGTASRWPSDEMVAAQVMRVVRADPSLLDVALAGDSGALATIRAAVKATPMPGVGYVARNDEEAALATQLMRQGKSSAGIQAALDDLRARRELQLLRSGAIRGV